MHLFVPVGPLLDSLGASTDVDSPLEIGALTMGECAFEPLGPARVTATLSNTGAGIVATGTVTARLKTTCVRCLCDFELDASAPIEGFYVLPGHDEGLPEEQEVELIADDKVDLAPAAVQSLIVELPFAPVHSESCAGLCPVCGADRNVSACGCETDDASSPFSALRGLLEPPAEEGGD